MIPPFSFNYFNDSVTVVLVNVVEVIVTVAVVEDVKLVVVTLVTVVVEDKLNVVLVVPVLVCLMAMWGGPSQRHRGHHRVSWMWRFEILGWFENLACNDLCDRVPLCWRYRYQKFFSVMSDLLWLLYVGYMKAFEANFTWEIGCAVKKKNCDSQKSLHVYSTFGNHVQATKIVQEYIILFPISTFLSPCLPLSQPFSPKTKFNLYKICKQ